MSSVFRPKKHNVVDVNLLFGKLFLDRTGVSGEYLPNCSYYFCSLSGLKIREEEDQHHQEVLLILLKATKSNI